MAARDSESFGSRRRLARHPRSNGSIDSDRGQHMYQPGAPIGYLAARGTPYEKKYFTKKLGFCCLFIAPLVILVVLAIALVPVLGAIARHALHTSQFHIYSSNITDIGNFSFPLSLQAQVKKTGIFPAHLYFREPIQVYWMSPPPNMKELHLGHFDLGLVGAAAGHAKVNQLTTFYIDDEEGFGLFAQFLVSQPEFTWRIKCSKVYAEAFSFFPVYKYLPLTKDIVIKGIDNLHNVTLVDVQLPGDDPAGGIQVSATASLINPSPFGIQIGTLGLALYYRNQYLGPLSTENLNLTSGQNLLTLSGRLVPNANNVTALEILGELFTNYINSVPSIVTAHGLTVVKPDGSVVNWLSTGITSLVTEIPFLPPQPIDPIKGITIDYISLVYSKDLPYNPYLFTNDLVGTFSLPFGFSLNITQLAPELNIITNGASVGTAKSSYGQSTTNITLLSSGQTAGDIHLMLPPSMLVLPNATDEAKRQLISFQNDFVYKSSSAFEVQGSAKAVTSTPIGEILLNGINFNVSTGLIGLNGLTTYPTIIDSVDVTGGSNSGVTLNVDLTLINPSNLNLSVGDTTFQLSNGDVLGTATLPNLILKPGRNDLTSTANVDPNSSPNGIETLNRFVSGLSTQLNITGFSGSTSIESLEPNLEAIKLNSTLPGLSSTLVKAANLTILDSTGLVDDVASSIVQLANPFSSELTITSISANASSHGIYIANIDAALNFLAVGKQTTASPVIPLTLNLYPPDLFGLLRALVVDSNQNPAYLDGLVSLAGYQLTPTTNADENLSLMKREDRSFIGEDDNLLAQRLMDVGINAGVLDVMYNSEEGEEEKEVQTDGNAKPAHPLSYSGMTKRDNLYTGFNLGNYVLQAFASAMVDLSIISDTLIGEYGTTLTFTQNNVPLGTDQTLLKLLPVLALPIVQKIVDGSILNIDRVTITDPRATSFTASLQGALTNAGPFDATVSFPNGLDISYNGQLLTQTAFPNIQLVGDIGSSINVALEGLIPDVSFFTSFLEDAIRNPSFIWNIRGSGISVSALGIVVPNITINKDVQLTGLNGLQGQVIINSFDLPSNDPAGGITLTASSSINNPAQVGITLSSFGINIMDGNVMIGPSAADGVFTLQALAMTQVPLVGRLIPQTSAEGLDTLSTLFTRFVHNQNTDLVISGEYAGPSDVVWLNQAIKVLSVVVSLPAQDFQVIRSISLNQLSLFFTVPTAWSPNTDSSNTEANFFLPFAFPVNITQISGPFTLNYNNADIAVLNIPTSPATTNVEARIITLIFSNIPLDAFNNAHSQFSNFVADFTKNSQVTLNLHGTTDALANTAAGALTISDIAFSVNTDLLGLQNLNARPATVSNLGVVHGYPTYLLITVITTIYNPSNTTVSAGDVTFAVLFQNNVIGTALINNIILVPGENQIPTQINYMPTGASNTASGQVLLEKYVQNVTSDAVVQGSSQTTPIQSLQQALGGITLNTEIPALNRLLVTQATLEVPKNIAQTGVASTTVTIANPFTASINVLNLHADADFQGIIIGTINDNLAASNSIIHVPGMTTVTSQRIPINLNIDPKNLIRFIEAAATTYGVDISPLFSFFQQVLDLPSTTTTITPYPDDSAPPCNSGRAFDTLGAILALLKPLSATVPIQSTLKLDDYQTDLEFTQSPVPIRTDNTALYLVGPAAAPLIQLIVNQSVLTVSQANATSLTDQGFMVSLIGSLMTDAPADAYIEFPDGITINFQGVDMARLTLTPICSSPPNGVPVLTNSGQLTITNEGQFERFSLSILTQPNFQWVLHTRTAVVRALGIKFSNVILEKTIQLDSFNGIPGLAIGRFEAPSDAPGRINIVADTPITSLASLGVELDYASFEILFKGSEIGFITSDLLFLAAKQTTLATFNGYLSDQSNNPTGLANIGILFSQFLAGTNSTLTIRGQSVVTRANNNQPVRWLTAAFKQFTDTVVLPGHIYQIIFSITLSDLTVTIENEADSYTIIGSNKMTVATFSNPFGFGLQPLSIKPLITLTYTDIDIAQINLPSTNVMAGTSHGPTDILPIQFGFSNQTITAISHSAFQSFLAQLADMASATFGLKGSTSVVAKTTIGNPTITGIPFNVSSMLSGISNFGGKAPLSDVVVNDPTSDYIGIHLTTTLNNPSNLTLYTNQLSLPAFYSNVVIGRATIPTLSLLPGNNNVMVLFEFMIPDNSTTVQEVLTLYLQPSDLRNGPPNVIPLDIKGIDNANPPLSPYDSLNPALAGLDLSTSLTGIATRVVVNIRVYIPINSISVDTVVNLVTPLLNGTARKLAAQDSQQIYVYSYIDCVNDLPVEISFDQLDTAIYNTDSPQDGTYAQFEHRFDDAAYILPAATATNQPSVDFTTSPQIPNILLTKSFDEEAANLIGHNLDIVNTIRLRISGPNGTYFIPGLSYTENNVNTNYFITLDDSGSDSGIPFEPSFTTSALTAVNLAQQHGVMPNLIHKLASLDPASPATVFQAVSQIPDGGPAAQSFLCANGVLQTYGAAACQTPEEAAASLASAALSTSSLSTSSSSSISQSTSTAGPAITPAAITQAAADTNSASLVSSFSSASVT